jgi:hypothetical protein
MESVCCNIILDEEHLLYRSSRADKKGKDIYFVDRSKKPLKNRCLIFYQNCFHINELRNQ